MRTSSFRANNQYIQWAFLDIFNIIGKFASREKTAWRAWVSPGFTGSPVIPSSPLHQREHAPA